LSYIAGFVSEEAQEMNRTILSAVVGVVCAFSGPVAAQAKGPTFSCARVQTDVEKLICSDAALASLDRQLAEVYKSAAAKARAPLTGQLRQEQRGWVKGRNDCWKAKGQPTWITASWTVDTVRGCVDAQYRLRIAELQAVWRLLPARTVAYACDNASANEVVANFFDTDPATLRLERGDRTTTLWRVGDAAGGTYEGQNVSAVHLGDSLAIKRLDTNTGQTEQLPCKAK
jgi:uncharacterized protein